MNEMYHLFAGVTAGTVSTVLLHPLDLIKVRMQVHEGAFGAYRGVWSALTEIFQREGLRGLYAGLSPAVLASALSWGGYFFFYEHSKKRKLFAYRRESLASSAPSVLKVTDHLAAGIEAGCAMVVITNPLWLMKTRLQLQGSLNDSMNKRGRYRGLVDTITTMYREEGLSGFYKGFLPALLLTSHGAVQFAVYEQLKVLTQRTFHRDANESTSAVLITINSSVSKIIASTVTYPYQVIKSRMQQRGVEFESASAPHQRLLSSMTGALTCCRHIYTVDGAQGFFKGLVPNTLKVIPSAIVTFVVYEECIKLFRRHSCLP